MMKLTSKFLKLPYELIYEISSYFKEGINFMSLRMTNKELMNTLSMPGCYSKAENAIFRCRPNRVPWKVKNKEIKLFEYVKNIKFHEFEKEENIIKILNTHTGITSVDLSNTKRTTNEITKYLTTFKTIKLNKCFDINDFSNFKKTTSLEIEGFSITLNKFNNLKKLTRLNMKHAYVLYCYLAIPIFKCIENIVYLNIDNCGDWITDDAITCLKKVVEISMTKCGKITKKAIKHLQSLKSVKSIGVSGCNGLCEEAFSYLAGIPVVDISYCKNVTDSIFPIGLREVKNLNASFCEGITDAAMVCLKEVKVLNISGCENITSNGLSHIFGLVELDVSFCPRIDNNVMKRVKEIRIINLNQCGTMIDSYGMNSPFKVSVINDFMFENINTYTICKIDLTDCIFISDYSLSLIPNVYDLTIDGCGINGSGFKYLKKIQKISIKGLTIKNEVYLKCLSNIHTIDMSNLLGVSDNALSYFKNSNTVTLSNKSYVFVYLRTSANHCFTDNGILHLKNVYNLTLSYIDVSNKVLSQLLCRNLKLRNCNKISLNFIKNIKELRSICVCDCINWDDSYARTIMTKGIARYNNKWEIIE